MAVSCKGQQINLVHSDFIEEAVFQVKIKTQRGFTIIELIMVMVIIAVIAVTAVPKFTSMSNVSVGGAAQMIQADIRYAQELAMAEHEAKSVTFDYGDDFYTVDSETNDLPSGVTIGSDDSSDDFTVTFNSLGEPTFPEGGDSVTISAGGEPGTIRVTDYTGKVSID